MVFRDDGPAVRQLTYGCLPGIDHGLDGEGHSLFELQARPGLAIVKYLGILMELAADSMAAKFAYYGITVFFGMRLNRSANVAQAGAGSDIRNPYPHALICDIAQASGLDAGLAHEIHPARIPVEAVLDHRDVDVQHIGRLQDAISRNSMANLMVDGRAN